MVSMDYVEKFLRKISLKQNDYVVVAVSGGPDSMALLNMLYQFQCQSPFHLVCAHVNHSKREESEDEAVFVKNYCEERNIIFEYLKIDDWGSKNFHDEAHHRRYNFFENIVNKYHARYLFTAHHGDDLMETILMRLTRGSTMYGYHGFSELEQRNEYYLARPLLHYSKNDLLNYVKKNNIPYVIDDSNTKDTYTRNRYRKVILPFLKKENPNVIEKFNEFSDILEEYESFVQKQARQCYNHIVHDECIEVTKYQQQDSLLRKKLLEQWLLHIYKERVSMLTKRHLQAIDKALCSIRPNTTIDLPDGYKLKRNYDKSRITHENFTNDSYDYVLVNEVVLPNGKKIEKISKSMETDNNICYLSSAELKLPLIVRSRRSGDIMEVKGLSGKKKIKDIFINEKIPVTERSMWPIVCDSDGTIVWLPGIKKSKFDKTKGKNYDIILKYH